MSFVALLRLARKYQIHKLKKIACERMLNEFPTTFPTWEISTIFYCWKSEETARLGVLAYDLLSLFQETGLQLQRLLPAAYLLYIWNSEKLVRHNVTNSPEIIIILTHPIISQSTIFHGRLREDGTRSTLSNTDQQKIIVGRETLIEESLKLLNRYFIDDRKIPTARCSDPSPRGLCASTRTKLFKKHSQLAIGHIFQIHLLQPITEPAS